MSLVKNSCSRIIKRSSSILAQVNVSNPASSSPIPLTNRQQLQQPDSSNRQHFYQNKTLDKYYSQAPTPLTLRQLIFYERHINTERLLKSANYVRTELPIRIAHRIREFQKLPYILGTNPHIQMVYDLYWQAFDRIRKVDTIRTRDENERFCEVLQESLDAHLVVIPQLAQGINECCEQQNSIMSMEKLDLFMNDTLRSRISRRTITEHHLVLSSRKPSIFNTCSSNDVLNKCIQLVKELAQKGSTDNNMIFPKITLEGHDTEFSYVSDHIEYILFQLLSNAYRHSTAYNLVQQKEIKVTLCSNETDVLFRISDQGGGMTKEVYKNLWSYGNRKRFANMDKIQQLEAKLTEYDKLELTLGIGLPMSRVYAEYWGGDINIMTMEGFGTDAYLRLPRLGTSNENISVHSLDEPIL